jgi:hypothetical protein
VSDRLVRAASPRGARSRLADRAGGLACVVAAACAAAAAARASPAEPALPPPGLESLADVRSMGQPPLWKPFAGAYYGRVGEGPRGSGLTLGVYRDLLPSVIGIGLSAEGRLGTTTRGADSGLRALAELRGLFLRTGFDWDAERRDVAWLLSAQLPLRRGGIVGRGSQLRADWVPGRGALSLGVVFPLEPHMGRTRPRRTDVDLPHPLPPAAAPPADEGVQQALGRMRAAASWILELSSVFFEDDRDDRLKSLERTRREIERFKARLGERDARRPRGHALVGEVEIFHAELARAFGLALGPGEAGAAERGAPFAELARELLLDEVVLPYNRLFGQYKLADSLLGLGARARRRFEAAAGAGARALGVFDGYLGILEHVRQRFLERESGDGRLAFVPFPLVLQPARHDSQEALDALLGRMAGTGFSPGNAALYINGQQFQRELLRTIHETESYHVLWLHDFDGVNAVGQVDSVALAQVLDGCLAALTRRGHAVRFPAGSDWARQRVLAAQRELREAVARSARLQEGARRLGQGWLRRTVKVHVSVTNPADFSYRSSRLVGYLPIAPDTAMRDHRKVGFRDVTEADPARGEALLSGAAVGEQYASPTWEDRAILAAGPALVALKDGARRNLLANGLREAEIKLHRKTRFFLDRDAVLALAARPEVAEALAEQLEARARVTVDPEGHSVPNGSRLGPVRPLVAAWRALPEETRRRAIAYMTVGSMNKDARGMMLDGEVAYVVAGAWSLQCYLDVFFLLGTTTWVDSQEQVDRLLPPYPQWQRRIGRWLRKAV